MCSIYYTEPKASLGKIYALRLDWPTAGQITDGGDSGASSAAAWIKCKSQRDSTRWKRWSDGNAATQCREEGVAAACLGIRAYWRTVA